MKKILVTLDGSLSSVKAAQLAVDMARLYSAELTFLTVVKDNLDTIPVGLDMSTHPDIARIALVKDIEAIGNEILEKIISDLDTSGIKTTKKVLTGYPAEEIVNYAESEAIDLIIIGRRGLSPFKRFFIGSVAQKIVAHAACSVLVVNE